ncbi:hypothetical protein C6P44_002236 [Monosporozyma unispora]|nr:hypothetical protein C6P44_002236 [Kazachstania unispora]
MNIPKLPGKQSVGHQLTSGVNGPGLLLVDQTDANPAQWIQPQDNDDKYKNFKFQLMKISDDFTTVYTSNKNKIGKKRAYISELRESDLEDESGTESADIDDFTDTETLLTDEEQLQMGNERRETTIEASSEREDSFQNLNWKDYIPIIEDYRPRIFKDINPMQNTLQLEHIFNERISTDMSHADYIPQSVINETDPTYEIKDFDSIKQKDSPFKIFDLSEGGSIVSNMVKTRYLQYNSQKNIIAYVTGKTASKVVLAVLSKIHSTDEFRLNLDSRYPKQVFDVHSKIKCIKFASLTQELYSIKNYVAILTDTALTLIRIEEVGKRKLAWNFKCSHWLTLPLNHFSEFPFADITFNPFKRGQCALIDVKGNWFVYDIPIPQPLRFRHMPLGTPIPAASHKGTIYDPSDLYSFKRISWSCKDSRLLLITSFKIVEVDLLEEWQRDIVEAASWSEIREFKNIVFTLSAVLTSKEIIIIDKDNNGVTKRLISWKHDLNPRDKTYKFSLHYFKFRDATLISMIIYSKINNMVSVHSFLLLGKNIQSIGEDSLLQVPEISSGIDSISDTHQSVDDDFSISDIKINLLMKGVDALQIRNYVLKVSTEETVKKNMTFYKGKDDTELFDKLFKPHGRVLSVARSLFQSITYNSPTGYDDSKDDGLLEEYGYQLSESLNKIIKKDRIVNGSGLLSDLHDSPDYFENLTEFSSLLEQFIQHYKGEDINFNNIKLLFSTLLNEPIDDIDVFHSKLLQCWEPVTSSAEHLTRELVKDLVLNFIRYFKPDALDDRYQDMVGSLDESYKAVLDGWGHEEDESMETTGTISNSLMGSQSQIFNRDSQPLIPTVGSSQKSKSKRRPTPTTRKPARRTTRLPTLSQTRDISVSSFPSSQLSGILPDNMTPAFTLMQPPLLSQGLSIPKESQDTSSQKPKKKKKKVGGFN